MIELRYLFVYGTLRRACSHPMARFLERNSQFIAPAKVRALLLDLGPFPGIVENANHWTHGEIVELSDIERILPELDQYEGCGRDPEPPLLYERRAIRAILEDEREMEAWAYFYTGPVENYRPIKEGRYPIR